MFREYFFDLLYLNKRKCIISIAHSPISENNLAWFVWSMSSLSCCRLSIFYLNAWLITGKNNLERYFRYNGELLLICFRDHCMLRGCVATHVLCEKNNRNKSTNRAHKVSHLGDIIIVIFIVQIEWLYFILFFQKYMRKIDGLWVFKTIN